MSVEDVVSWVEEEGRVVTFRWVALMLQVSVDAAKELLQRYVEQCRGGGDAGVMYALSGRRTLKRDTELTDAGKAAQTPETETCFMLVSGKGGEAEREKVRREMGVLRGTYEEHVFSVQPAPAHVPTSEPDAVPETPAVATSALVAVDQDHARELLIEESDRGEAFRHSAFDGSLSMPNLVVAAPGRRATLVSRVSRTEQSAPATVTRPRTSAPATVPATVKGSSRTAGSSSSSSSSRASFFGSTATSSSASPANTAAAAAAAATGSAAPTSMNKKKKGKASALGAAFARAESLPKRAPVEVRAKAPKRKRENEKKPAAEAKGGDGSGSDSDTSSQDDGDDEFADEEAEWDDPSAPAGEDEILAATAERYKSTHRLIRATDDDDAQTQAEAAAAAAAAVEDDENQAPGGTVVVEEDQDKPVERLLRAMGGEEKKPSSTNAKKRRRLVAKAVFNPADGSVEMKNVWEDVDDDGTADPSPSTASSDTTTQPTQPLSTTPASASGLSKSSGTATGRSNSTNSNNGKATAKARSGPASASASSKGSGNASQSKMMSFFSRK